MCQLRNSIKQAKGQQQPHPQGLTLQGRWLQRSPNTPAWWEELTHCKNPWCWGKWGGREVGRLPWVAKRVKNLSAMQETQIRFLGQEDALKKGMATHSSILAWTTPRTEEPGWLQPMGSKRVGHNWATSTFHVPFQRRGDRGWDGWMASLSQWKCIWANSGR